MRAAEEAEGAKRPPLVGGGGREDDDAAAARREAGREGGSSSLSSASSSSLSSCRCRRDRLQLLLLALALPPVRRVDVVAPRVLLRVGAGACAGEVAGLLYESLRVLSAAAASSMACFLLRRSLCVVWYKGTGKWAEMIVVVVETLPIAH